MAEILSFFGVVFLRSVRRATLIVTYVAIGVAVAHPVAAAKMADASAQWIAGTGMSVLLVPQTALAAGDTITLTFPAEARVSSGFLFYAPGDDPVTVTGQGAVSFVRNATDNSVTITLRANAPRGEPLTITLDTRVITTYDATAYAQQSIAINTMTADGAPIDYGIALITGENATEVTATVPLLVSLRVDDTTVNLGTLSTARVVRASQRYTVTTNNVSGATVSLRADGPLRDAHGNVIPAITGGHVVAGQAGYGFSVENINAPLMALAPYAHGEHALPEYMTPIVRSAVPVSGATFDVQYAAAIDGTTVAGDYAQTVVVTIATNS